MIIMPLCEHIALHITRYSEDSYEPAFCYLSVAGVEQAWDESMLLLCDRMHAEIVHRINNHLQLEIFMEAM